MALSEKDMEKIEMIVELVCNRLAAVEPKPVGVEELAEFLGVEKAWVYGQTKKLPHFKAGRHTVHRHRCARGIEKGKRL